MTIFCLAARLTRRICPLLVIATACATAAAQSNLRQIPSADEVIERLRSLTAKALAAPAADRAKLFSEVQNVAGEWLRLESKNPRSFLVRAQSAIATAAEAEALRQDAEIAAGTEPNWDAARATARKAIAAWKLLGSDVEAELLRRPRGARGEQGSLTALELNALERNCRYERARALRNQSLCYTAESADRVNALSQALELLVELENSPIGDPLIWPARVKEVTCRRLMGDYPTAKRLINSIAADGPPPVLEPQIAAEKIRLYLATNELAEMLQATKVAPTKTTADWELARLEAFIAALQARPTDTRWRQTVLDQARRIKNAYPGYWARRAESLVVANIPGVESDFGKGAVDRSASASRNEGDWQAAVKKYDLGAAEALKAKSADEAFRFRLLAATELAQHDQPVEASERYRQAALENSQHRSAEDAHSLAIRSAGKALQAIKSPDVRPLCELLDEHLKLWPRSASAAQTRLQLAKLSIELRDWPRAIDALQAISPTDPLAAQAATLLADCRIRQIEALDAAGSGQDATRLAESLAKEFPNRAEAQELYARLLSKSTDATELHNAIAKWRDIWDKTNPGSPRWFRAAYGMAQAQYDLGQKPQARALIKVTAVRYPDFGGGAMQAKFEALLKACEQESSPPN